MRRSLLVLAFAALGLCACGARTHESETVVTRLRADGQRSNDPEAVAEWMFGELVSPGGLAKQVSAARARLDRLGAKSWLAELSRALDDEMHGRLKRAPDEYLRAAEAARVSGDPRAPLGAWYAIIHARRLASNAPDLWDRWKTTLVAAMAQPRNMGWRARADLVDWWADQAYDAAEQGVDESVRKEQGCVTALRLAGPFGRAAAPDVYRSFPAEAPGPWPASWPRDTTTGRAPHVLDSQRHGCLVTARESVADGVFYAESYVTVGQPRDLILAVQGALAIWIDDQRVLVRDPRVWGNWTEFGVQVRLDAGRHRVLARLRGTTTSLRFMTPDGRPLALPSSVDPTAPYTLTRPELGPDPNLLDRYVSHGKLVEPDDDVARMLAGALADYEGQDDVASVLFEPLVKNTSIATGPSLVMAASFAHDDPIYDDSTSKDLVQRLQDRAVRRDPELWLPRLDLALSRAEKSGAIDGVNELRALVRVFPDVPGVMSALARLYGELGWTVEYNATIHQMVDRFPTDDDALHSAVEVFESEGRSDVADELVRRIQKQDPDDEIVLTRALGRRDYDTALAELKRLGARRPERKDIAERIFDVMVRAGNEAESWNKLEAVLKKDPKNTDARLDLADARYASGDHGALSRALVDAVVAGADTGALKEALDLLEGVSELEPYRLDALPIISEYEKNGKRMPGTAARVLDYAAVWVHADGSSRMLEHEIIRIQSPEAVSHFAEHPRLDGLVLHMRVIKPDGTILEPEDVHGKPTVTLPHLEVGDYIETEHITSEAGDGEFGLHYLGPRWFFREENIAYARSEFVMITPKVKPIVIETSGNVPAPVVTDSGALVTRRWRVDYSPAAPSEPNSAPASEFLPSVQLAWGIDLKERLQSVADSLAPVVPVDPRIARIAQKVVADATTPEQRAQRLFRWTLKNVNEGEESDGRRAVISGQGNLWRAFEVLCRAVDLEPQFALAQNRLAPPPRGPISAAGLYTEPLMRLALGRRTLWLSLANQYTPFGYVPAEARGMPAYVLDHDSLVAARTPSGGVPDKVTYTGKVELDHDGAARIELAQTFDGKMAIALRRALSQLPEAQLHDAIESYLLGAALRGARLIHHKIEHVRDLDEPVIVHMTADMPTFAQQSGNVLIISPPFTPDLSKMAALPERQTPMLIPEATDQEVEVDIRLPSGARLAVPLATHRVDDGSRRIAVSDHADGDRIVLARSISLPAGRVQPEEYKQFLAFARRADDALHSSIRVLLR